MTVVFLIDNIIIIDNVSNLETLLKWQNEMCRLTC